MGISKDQAIHDLNSLLVKIKSIVTLTLEGDHSIKEDQMLKDGDQVINELTELWNQIKKKEIL